MRYRGRIMVVLVPGEARGLVPSQLDCLIGAALPATRLGDPRVDDVLGRGEDYLVTGVYHSRRSFGRVGEQHLDFDPLEERLGLSRTYSVQLSDPARAGEVVQRLRDLSIVESASEQTLAVTPYSVTAAQDALPAGLDPWAPHDQVQARQAHDMEPGDQAVWVGLVDTGISLPHPEFRRKLLAGYDTVRLGMGGAVGDLRLVGSSHGDDFAPRDAVGHGSHVGGIVGAHGWRMPPGVGRSCMLLPIRVLAAAMDSKAQKLVGVGALPDINAGLKVAVDMGADVLNLSSGRRRPPSPTARRRTAKSLPMPRSTAASSWQRWATAAPRSSTTRPPFPRSSPSARSMPTGTDRRSAQLARISRSALPGSASSAPAGVDTRRDQAPPTRRRLSPEPLSSFSPGPDGTTAN